MATPAKTERADYPFPHLLGYLQSRMEQIQTRRTDPALKAYFRKRDELLFHSTGETEFFRRDSLPTYPPIRNTRIDRRTGFLYTHRWSPKRRLLSIFEPLGQQLQLGRDYMADPPDKEIRQLQYAEHGKGLEVMQRGMWHVAERYLVSSVDPKSAGHQYRGIVEMTDGILTDLVDFPHLTPQDLEERARKKIQFLEENGLTNPLVREKQKWADTLAKGYTDKNGRQSVQALMFRWFALSVDAIKLDIGNFKTFSKYAAYAESAGLLRDAVRFQLQRADQVVGNLLQTRPFVDRTIATKPARVQQGYVDALLVPLGQLSRQLDASLDVHPYNVGAGRLLRMLGFIRSDRVFKFFPDGRLGEHTKKKWDASKNANSPQTIVEFLSVYDYAQTARLMKDFQQMIALLLTKNVASAKSSQNLEKEKQVPKWVSAIVKKHGKQALAHYPAKRGQPTNIAWLEAHGLLDK